MPGTPATVTSSAERCAHSALRIVLARDRRTEQRHYCVADELLHRPAPALELVAQALVVRRKDSLDVLRIEPLGLRSEADEVGEEDGQDLALGGARGPSLSQRRGALGTELRTGLVLVATVRAGGHSEKRKTCYAGPRAAEQRLRGDVEGALRDREVVGEIEVVDQVVIGQASRGSPCSRS